MTPLQHLQAALLRLVEIGLTLSAKFARFILCDLLPPDRVFPA